MNIEDLKQEIIDNIYTNGDEEITGEMLQGVLLDMVDTVGTEGNGLSAGNGKQSLQAATCNARGNNSFAVGLGTETKNSAEFAAGKYNKSNVSNDIKGQTLASIGCGDNNNRKNAVEIMQNGDVYVKGIGGYDGTNTISSKTKTLQEIVNSGSGGSGGSKVKVSNTLPDGLRVATIIVDGKGTNINIPGYDDKSIIELFSTDNYDAITVDKTNVVVNTSEVTNYTYDATNGTITFNNIVYRFANEISPTFDLGGKTFTKRFIYSSVYYYESIYTEGPSVDGVTVTTGHDYEGYAEIGKLVTPITGSSIFSTGSGSIYKNSIFERVYALNTINDENARKDAISLIDNESTVIIPSNVLKFKRVTLSSDENEAVVCDKYINKHKIDISGGSVDLRGFSPCFGVIKSGGNVTGVSYCETLLLSNPVDGQYAIIINPIDPYEEDPDIIVVDKNDINNVIESGFTQGSDYVIYEDTKYTWYQDLSSDDYVVIGDWTFTKKYTFSDSCTLKYIPNQINVVDGHTFDTGWTGTTESYTVTDNNVLTGSDFFTSVAAIEPILPLPNGVPLDENSPWKHYAPNNIEGKKVIWMASRFIENNVFNDWDGPWRISGADGEAGVDGGKTEYIYAQTESETTQPADPNSGTPATPGKVVTDDDFVPMGWTDNAQGVTRALPCEWMSMRMKRYSKEHPEGVWGEFSTPALWSKYGKNGMDGDGIEYIYYAGSTHPTDEPSSWDTTDPEFQTREWIPSGSRAATSGSKPIPGTGWADDPFDIDADMYAGWMQWVSVRNKYTDSGSLQATWHAYSDAAFWSNHAKDGDAGDGVIGHLDNESVAVSLKSTGDNYAVTGQSVNAFIYNGPAVVIPTIITIDVTDTLGNTYPSQTWLTVDSTDHNKININIPEDAINLGDKNLIALVQFSATINGETVTRLATLNLIGVMFGEDGASYRLGVNSVVIYKSKGNNPTYFPETITPWCIKTLGNEPATTFTPTDSAAGFTFKYEIDNSGTELPLTSSSVSSSLASSSIRIELDYSGSLVDQQTVQIIEDGEDGVDGEGVEYIFYADDSYPISDPTEWTNDEHFQEREYIRSGSGWTDDPVDLTDDRYIGWKQWVSMRRKYANVGESTATWKAYSSASLWAIHAENGVAIVGHLNDDNMLVSLDEDGLNNAFTGSTVATIYNGENVVNAVVSGSITVSGSNGIDYTSQGWVTNSGSVIDVDIPAKSLNMKENYLIVSIPITANIGGTYITPRLVTLTIVGVHFGEDGSSYRLGLNSTIVRIDRNNNYYPPAISASCIKTVGDENMSIFTPTAIPSGSGFAFKYQIDDQSPTLLSTDTVTSSLASSSIRIELDHSGSIVDQQTILIYHDPKDGKNVTSIDEWYKINDSDVTPPSGWGSSSGWSLNSTPSVSLQPGETKYLWNYEVSNFDDGPAMSSSKTMISVLSKGANGTNGRDGTDGTDGTDGAPGADGVGIQSIVNYYLAVADTSSLPSRVGSSESGKIHDGGYVYYNYRNDIGSLWTTNPQDSAAQVSKTNPYLLNFEEIIYTNAVTNNTYFVTSIRTICIYSATDIEYITDIFPEIVGSTNSALIGGLVGVNLSGSNHLGVMLNGTDIGSSSTHGKLFISSGFSSPLATSGGADGTFRVYQDGHVIANSIEVCGTVSASEFIGGTLSGSNNINDGMLSVSGGNGYAMMNATSTGSSSAHGTLAFAAGMSSLASASYAPFRVYSDGYMVAGAGSVTGELSVGENGCFKTDAQLGSTHNNMTLNNDNLIFSSVDTSHGSVTYTTTINKGYISVYRKHIYTGINIDQETLIDFHGVQVNDNGNNETAYALMQLDTNGMRYRLSIVNSVPTNADSDMIYICTGSQKGLYIGNTQIC